MNANQDHEEQARKLDQFHDKYHRQKPPDWFRAEAEGEVPVHTPPAESGRHTLEIDEQQQEGVRKHLEGVIKRMEQIIDSPIEIALKRIDVDAATIAALAVISELLPEQIQQQIRTIVALHEKTWKLDLPAVAGETQHKPLSEELMDTVAHEDDSSEV
jgi:hypothetical protein